MNADKIKAHEWTIPLIFAELYFQTVEIWGSRWSPEFHLQTLH